MRAQLEISCSYPGGGEAVVGVPFDKIITIMNTGDAPAEGVVLDDRPDPGLDIVDGGFPMQIGTIDAGQTVTQTIRLVANQGGSFQNRVIVSSSTSGAQAENVCPIEVVQGNLEITKICEPPNANAGQEVSFVVTVQNTGRGPLENVMVQDDYPQGIEPTSQNVATVGRLGPGDSRQVIFTGIAELPGVYTNIARAVADGVQEKQAQCELKVVLCKLEMDLTGPDQIYYGEQANFTVNVRNVGDGPAEACIVRVSTGDCLGNVVRDFNVGPLTPGETWTQDFAAMGAGVGSCVVEADSNCGARCQIRRDVELKVTGLPALQVEMVDRALDGSEAGVFHVGETFLYTMVVENDVGTEVTPDMKVVWRLPPELEFVSGRSDRQAGVNGSGANAASDPFTLGLNERITFAVQVRVVSAPKAGWVKTHALVLRALDDAVLADETESTSLRN